MYLSFQCFVLPDTQIPKYPSFQVFKLLTFQLFQFVIFRTLKFPHFPTFDSLNIPALKLELCNFIVTRLTTKKYGRNGSKVMGATNSSQTFRWLSPSNLVVLIILSEGRPPVEGGVHSCGRRLNSIHRSESRNERRKVRRSSKRVIALGLPSITEVRPLISSRTTLKECVRRASRTCLR